MTTCVIPFDTWNKTLSSNYQLVLHVNGFVDDKFMKIFNEFHKCIFMEHQQIPINCCDEKILKFSDWPGKN